MQQERHRWRFLPIGVVVAVLVVGLALIATDHWRRGGVAFGIAALLAAVLRVVLPEQAVGVLGVRGKLFDVCFLLVLAGLLAAAVAQPG